MPTVSSCCGLKLRTGSLLIGYVEVFTSFIGVVLCALMLIYIDELGNRALCRNVSMIGLSIFVLTLIVGLFLTNGITNTDRAQIKPWVVIKGIMLCFEFGVIFLTVWVIQMEYSRGHDLFLYLVALPIEFLVTGECFFFFWCVNL